MQGLVSALRTRSVILFVGAGVSMNLGLPSFRELVKHLGQELGYDPEIFSTLGEYLSLAEFYQLQQGSLGPLRSWMDREWHKPSVDIGGSVIHQRIVELRFPIIYTTNYDRWLELAHEHHGVPYVKVANVADFARVSEGTTQIVKFHGDFDDDASLVLTESSYFERLAFEMPLDIKLRSDSLGRSILFLGYSLADVNVRYLLYKLHKQWATSGHQAARPKSYIFLARPNPIQERILEERGIVPIVSESDDPKAGLTEFLERLGREVVSGPRE